MSKQYPCRGLNRRIFLASTASAPIWSAAFVSASEPQAAAPPRGQAPEGKLGVPGPYPGRVLEVRNPRMIRQGRKDAGAIRQAVDRGMKELTGADDAVSGWRRFFEPGDVVAIKMNPVGNPLANSSSELMLAVIEGLRAAGVKTRDIFIYDRYRENFLEAGMHHAVPEGIKWGGLTPENDPSQLLIDWPSWRNDSIAGYDPDQFIEMNLVHHGHDPKDDRNFRSHLGRLLTRTVRSCSCPS
jgi:hypothetical protein